ncbi:4-hydroxy-tetrahydrodipicolinate reductase [Roseicitreum antarcticum]|uniref:4-hydroxy-tetrahydrodipicolinate reductase n=1 Tax=Roseicitreum antarcticum TaxID=564137 RepID=A0A1H2RQV0_9RHOB|nr:4-hydroxy-tetrahydrodipicolinate reductase [Roseicitreum antarcticum]SDW21791.1 dihydrodipicolinate reductase [Roseicitreum antarcticum]
MTNILVTGATGRMGQMLIGHIVAHPTARLTGALERAGSPRLGEMAGPGTDVRITDDMAAALHGADVVIDFTAPAASVALARHAADVGVAHIIGTTGFSEDDLAAIAAAGQRNTIVRAGNMSLGVNLLVQLTRKVAAALDEEYDIEVIEAHHRHKVDAPSGTALMLGEAAAEGRGVALADVSDRGRDGITGARERGRIGFAAIRGGDIIGEHDVLFAADGERITLRHVASDRAVFARGAIRAALWSVGKPHGEYSMIDVLGL